MRTCAIVVLRGVVGRAPGVGRRRGRRRTRREARRRDDRRLFGEGNGETGRARPRRGRRRGPNGKRAGRGCVRNTSTCSACGRCRRRRRSRPPSPARWSATTSSIEKLHFQSRPGLYVTGNLYRPKKVEGQAAGDPLRLRPLQPRPRRQQDGLPGPRHVVRQQRLRLPDHRHAAARRDPRHPPRHLQPRPLVVARGAATRRPASSAGTASAPSTIWSAGPTWTPSASA